MLLEWKNVGCVDNWSNDSLCFHHSGPAINRRALDCLELVCVVAFYVSTINLLNVRVELLGLVILVYATLAVRPLPMIFLFMLM